MLVTGILGFQTLLLPFLVLIVLWIQHKWRNAAARKEEIIRLVDMVSKESSMDEFEVSKECYGVPRPPRCAVCFCPTTTRCSQCKSVHYCSGKCQIIHWRQGHKDECQLLKAAMHLKGESEFGGGAASDRQPRTHDDGTKLLVDDFSTVEKTGVSGTGRFEVPSEDIAPSVRVTKTSSKEIQETKLPTPMSNKLVNYVDTVDSSSKLSRIKYSANDRGADCKSHLNHTKVVGSEDARVEKLGHKKSIRRAASSDLLVTDDSKDINSPSSRFSRLDSTTNGGEDDLRLFKGKEVRSFSFSTSGDHPEDACDGIKRSMWRKVPQLSSSKQSQSYKMLFPYEQFVKLYSCDEELYPFGLRNCGNSCYANSVLQCLAFTRPLTSYLVRGIHSNSCRNQKWCFICEFECLILKARKGQSPLSPIGILSKIRKIGSHLGQGTEEDAHEFLRYAVDTMQSICLKEAGGLGPLAEETTLVDLTFGGYLRSKITCTRCLGKSERFERIMDLTVEIDGDIRTLEEALAQFTAEEMLDGDNKYKCSRCKVYVKARKKLMIAEAPNILTIVLKRFRSGSFEKLNKSVWFPEVLNMSPYMCGKSDKSPQYSLYAVIVHRDQMNATSTGHYVCYVKNFCGDWFAINDSTVIHVQSERVLSEEAYMLLYARHSPRTLSSLRENCVSRDVRSKKRNLEAIPSSRLTPKTTEYSKGKQKNYKYPERTTPDNSTSYQLHDQDDWRFHAMNRVAHVDSFSDSSSLFSCSDASSCSTASTKDSVRSDDFTDFLFGDVGPSWYSQMASDSIAGSSHVNVLQREKGVWR